MLAPELIPLIYGERWAASGDVAQILCLMALPFTLNFFAGPVFSALGHSADVRRLLSLQVLLTVTLSLAAVPFGLLAVAAAYVFRAYVTFPIQIWLLWRRVGIRPARTLRAVASPMIGVAVMAVVLLIAKGPLASVTSDLALVLLLTVAGTVIYGAVLAVLEPKLLLDLTRVVRSLRAAEPELEEAQT